MRHAERSIVGRLTARSSKCYDSAVRGFLVVMVMAMTTLPVSACGDDDSSDDAASEETLAVDVPDVVGDSVEDATETLEDAGLTLRVVRRDGEDLPVDRRLRGEPRERCGRDVGRRQRGRHRGRVDRLARRGQPSFGRRVQRLLRCSAGARPGSRARLLTASVTKSVSAQVQSGDQGIHGASSVGAGCWRSGEVTMGDRVTIGTLEELAAGRVPDGQGRQLSRSASSGAKERPTRSTTAARTWGSRYIVGRSRAGW